MDYLAEILRALRNHDFSDRYKTHFKLSDDISTRDRDGINKTFSGLMKVIYPHGEASAEEIGALLHAAIEGRKRVKDQLLRIDSTYPAVRFTYIDQQGNERAVTTLEEEEYPAAYHQRITAEAAADPVSEVVASVQAADSPTAALKPEPVNAVSTTAPPTAPTLKEQHLVFQENQRGVAFDKLFGPYLVGAKRIIVTDPYLRMFHQQRNLMELLETISRNSKPEDEVAVHVVTVEDEFSGDRQTENFEKMAAACTSVGIQFSWAYDTSGTKHDRDITTDHGWKIVLSRGLDVFQRCELNDAFSFANRMQQHRQCKEFNVTFVRLQ